jgi:RNA polymerase sigma factor (sigma-70 family)
MAEDDQSSKSLFLTFLEHRAKLLGFLRYAGAGDYAEDLMQEAWIRLNAVTGVAVEEPLSYLYRLLHNLLLDRQRSAMRTQRRDETWVDAVGPDDRNVSDDPSADRILVAREHLAAVQRKLEELGEPTAGIFRRHRIGGELQRDIAQDLGMGLSTVESHLRKAYRAMLALGESFDEA